MSGATSAFTTGVAGPPVEKMIVRDMLRRCWPGLVALVALGAVWGIDGALSAGYGVGLAVLNAIVAAALLTAAARISLAAVAAAALGGYILRLALITTAVLLIVHRSWVELVPLCIGLVAAHLGLFVWEARFVSTQLAFPGLKPTDRTKETAP